MRFNDNCSSFSQVLHFFFPLKLIWSRPSSHLIVERGTYFYLSKNLDNKSKKDQLDNGELFFLPFFCFPPPPSTCVTLWRYSSSGYKGLSVQFWILPLSAMIFLIVRYESAAQCRSHVIFTGWGNYWKLRIAALKTEGYFHDPISIRVGKLFMPSEDSMGKSIVNAHSF